MDGIHTVAPAGFVDLIDSFYHTDAPTGLLDHLYWSIIKIETIHG
jgi:hypothetical protein